MFIESILPDIETELADHLNDVAAELAELREIAERVEPVEGWVEEPYVDGSLPAWAL